MRRITPFVFTLFLNAIAFISFAQNTGPVVFTVDGDTVWGGEFERVFSKNNKVESEKPTIEELQEYLDLYIKFKLKVKEAYALQMDTSRAYQMELSGYRRTLSQPYLTDKKVTEHLIEEAYERKKYEVSASNLMVHCSPVASPEDTLKAYNRIKAWRDAIVNQGMDFETLARDSSTDESARRTAGNLGYFTVFNMIYKFENMAYNTPVGQVSPIFRTEYGYHILKVNDMRPSRGERKVAHILLRVNSASEVEEKKEKIDAVYNELKAGADWKETVQRYSQDFSSTSRGGELMWIGSISGTDGVPPPFRDAAFKLVNIGDYSEPVLTEVGWHIIKLIDSRGIDSLEKIKETLKYRISKDQRGEINEEAVLNRIKQENSFIPNNKNVEAFMETLTSDVKKKAWKPEPFHESEVVMFTIAGKPYTYADFSKYLLIYQPFGGEGTPHDVGMRVFEKYVDEMNLDYEKSILEDKYPKFKYLMQEYRDGILLFELTSKMVWEKAAKDTSGLKEYFESHRNDYRWNKRADLVVYSCKTEKLAKKVQKMIDQGKSDAEITSKLNKKDPLAVQISMKRVESGVDTTYKTIPYEKGIYTFDNGSKNHVLVKVTEVIEPGLKEMSEVKGPVTSDYQEYLEAQWIADLKRKYEVHVNEGALRKLFNN